MTFFVIICLQKENSGWISTDFHNLNFPFSYRRCSHHSPQGYKNVYYGMPSLGERVSEEARLGYRQADQEVAEALLSAVPEDMDLKEIYGLTEIPELPVVNM